MYQYRKTPRCHRPWNDNSFRARSCDRKKSGGDSARKLSNVEIEQILHNIRRSSSTSSHSDMGPTSRISQRPPPPAEKPPTLPCSSLDDCQGPEYRRVPFGCPEPPSRSRARNRKRHNEDSPQASQRSQKAIRRRQVKRLSSLIIHTQMERPVGRQSRPEICHRRRDHLIASITQRKASQPRVCI